MRYAVISDIHGNKPALDAVLEDARAYKPRRELLHLASIPCGLTDSEKRFRME